MFDEYLCFHLDIDWIQTLAEVNKNMQDWLLLEPMCEKRIFSINFT